MVKPAPVPGQGDDGRKTAKAAAREGGSLKGTFVCVLLLGAFIALSWLAVFWLFVERNA